MESVQNHEIGCPPDNSRPNCNVGPSVPEYPSSIGYTGSGSRGRNKGSRGQWLNVCPGGGRHYSAGRGR